MALNREVIDVQSDRIAIHTHEIELTQEHIPYKPVDGKRLASEKHFAVYADKIILSGNLQNPGRNIELRAREIVIDSPSVIDAAGASAERDFTLGDLPIQENALPGSEGTSGIAGTHGGDSGNILISAQRIHSASSDKKTAQIDDLISMALRAVETHIANIPDVIEIGTIEVARLDWGGGSIFTVDLQQGRLEGVSSIQCTSSFYDSSQDRFRMHFVLPKLWFSGIPSSGSKKRANSKQFNCEIFVDAKNLSKGKLGSIAYRVQVNTAPNFDFFKTIGGGEKIPKTVVKSLQTHLPKQLGDTFFNPVLIEFTEALSKTPLVLIASGGKGGRGQDGHPGIQGTRGDDGATTRYGVMTPNGPGFPEDAYGKRGHTGGRAGSPGASGDGGNGGSILVNVMDSVTPDMVFSTNAGLGGETALKGARGLGGKGGRGALCKMYDQKSGKHLNDKRAPDGKHGPEGPPATHSGNQGEAGEPGKPLVWNGNNIDSVERAPLTFADLAPSLSLIQLLITQNNTDINFLNVDAGSDEDRSLVASGYEWLIKINQPFSEGQPQADSTLVSTEEQAVREGIRNSAIVSMMRLQQGLDFFGHSYNWAPVLDLNSLLKRTDQLLDLGKIVEDQYNRYQDQSKDDKTRLKNFKKAKQEIDRKLGGFESEMTQLVPQIESFESEIYDYTLDLHRQRTVLLEGELEFRDELVKYLHEQNDIEFGAFLELLGTVIGCVGGVVSGVGGVKSAFDAVKAAETFSKKVSNVVEIFKKAKATVDNIKKAYTSVKDATNNDNPNAVKIMVDADDFDKMIKEYLGKFEAADELRAAMNHYLELAQARNMAAYNYTTLVAQYLNIQTQHDQLYSGIQHVNAEMAEHQNNLLPLYTAYLANAYEDMQRLILRNLYLQNRAYRYWSLHQHDLKTENLSIATLVDTHQKLISNIDQFRENNEAFSDFHQKIIISADEYPNEFKAMRESRSLAFNLDIREQPGFLNMRYVVAKKFKMEFPSLDESQNALFLNLIHGGQAVFNSNTDLDQQDSIHAFSHRPRVRLYKIDYGDRENTAGGNFGEGGQGYVGLSPFSNWRIDFDLRGNDWLDLNLIDRIVLTFEGRMLGPRRSI